MNIEQRVEKVIRRNVEWLRTHQVSEEGLDQGAIRDPVREKVIGDNYATEEFAVACAYLVEQTSADGLIKPTQEALEFHQRTTEGYPKGEHTEHYQHRRLGFVDAFLAIRDQFDSDVEESMLNTVKSWTPKRNSSNCNWHMMNSLLGAIVDDLTGSWLHKTASRVDLLKTVTYWRPDGFFADSFDPVEWEHVSPAYYPLAYHAYTTALLHRYWRRTNSLLARTLFKKAVESLSSVVTGTGDIAYRGRSAGHIFTYGVGFYVFTAAAREFEGVRYSWLAERILSRLEELQASNGQFPVVANPEARNKIMPCQARYAYHSVYNAHCSAWLARALSNIESLNGQCISQKAYNNQHFDYAGLYCYSNSLYSAVLSDGSGGNFDSPLSLAMLDVNGKLGVFPPHAGDDDSLSGHTCWLSDGSNFWSNIRTSGSISHSGSKISGETEQQTPFGYFHNTREYYFTPRKIIIYDMFKLDGDQSCEIKYGIALNNEIVVPCIDKTTYQRRCHTVLGDGTYYFIQNEIDDQPVHTKIELKIEDNAQ